jgi:hypothetical protein
MREPRSQYERSDEYSLIELHFITLWLAKIMRTAREEYKSERSSGKN